MKFTALSIAAMLPMMMNIVDSSSSSSSSPEQSGKTNYHSVEAVLAHYDEDITWIDDVRKEDPSVQYTVYSKNSIPPFESIRLPNVGRESHTYLHHIVHNYHHLADWTIFSQAAAPTFGFRANNAQSGHMCSGVFWENYTEAFPNGEDWYMVQTVATRYPEIWHSDRLDMMFKLDSSDGETCPSADPEISWSMWWYSDLHPLVTKQKKQEQQENVTDPVTFYNKYIVADATDKTYDSFTLNFANGGRFAVSRERILTRPLEYYEDLLEELANDVNPIEGYYMESMWYDVFHPDHLQAEYGQECNLRALPGDASDHPTMMQQTKRQLVAYLEATAATLPSIKNHAVNKRDLQEVTASSPYFETADVSLEDGVATTSGLSLVNSIDEVVASSPYFETDGVDLEDIAITSGTDGSSTILADIIASSPYFETTAEDVSTTTGTDGSSTLLANIIASSPYFETTEEDVDMEDVSTTTGLSVTYEVEDIYEETAEDWEGETTGSWGKKGKKGDDDDEEDIMPEGESMEGGKKGDDDDDEEYTPLDDGESMEGGKKGDDDDDEEYTPLDEGEYVEGGKKGDDDDDEEDIMPVGEHTGGGKKGDDDDDEEYKPLDEGAKKEKKTHELDDKEEDRLGKKGSKMERRNRRLGAPRVKGNTVA
eukprot:CAMPEP_0194029340 /NCGR_PEP_ID=MMETSP0009_2-20130614/3085_1 /TAXON_ID=210454 /ORGANISM="Grammatophora oceanica, Strain CCMP 410" /LENGTH=651 /DNA_ID=CAMNT_0038668971 /DNA_START=60 /DNA_END=2015 /DNA_ORIENTATION=+